MVGRHQVDRGAGPRDREGHPGHPHLVHPHGRSADRAADRPDPRRHLLHRERRDQVPGEEFPLQRIAGDHAQQHRGTGQAGPRGGRRVEPVDDDPADEVCATSPSPRCRTRSDRRRAVSRSTHDTRRQALRLLVGGAAGRPLLAGCPRAGDAQAAYDFWFTRLRTTPATGTWTSACRPTSSPRWSTTPPCASIPRSGSWPLADPTMLTAPFCYLAGHKLVEFNAAEREQLRALCAQWRLRPGRRLQPRHRRPVRQVLRAPDGRRSSAPRR